MRSMSFTELFVIQVAHLSSDKLQFVVFRVSIRLASNEAIDKLKFVGHPVNLFFDQCHCPAGSTADPGLTISRHCLNKVFY